MPFRPALLPTVFVLAGLMVLVNLGLWQLRRHQAAEATRATVQERLYGEPATNADLATAPSSLAWRKAVLTGTFLEAPIALISGRFEFGESGYDIIQPLAVDGGPTVLVNRGWIPSADWEETLRTVQPTGPTTVEGLLQPIEPDTVGEPVPADATHPERWMSVQRRSFGVLTGNLGPPYATLATRVPGATPQLYLTTGPALKRGQAKSRASLPVTGYVAQPRDIGHLEYAVQWFLIALTLVLVWAYASYRRGVRLAA